MFKSIAVYLIEIYLINYKYIIKYKYIIINYKY